MAIWKLFENAIGGAGATMKEKKAELPVPTIVVTPVLEEDDAFDNIAAWTTPTKSTSPKTQGAQTVNGLPTPPSSPPANSTTMSSAVPPTGLGISGLPVQEKAKADYSDPLNEVDDLLEILGLNIEEERDEVEREIEELLDSVIVEDVSKLVYKSKMQYLELSREWKLIMEREYLPAKREAKLTISESFAMSEYYKSRLGKERTREDRLFSAIVLADSSKVECQAAFDAVEKIYKLQNLALSKYATRLKDHKILPLATHRRFVRKVKRTEREMEGWLRKSGAAGRILIVGEKMLNEIGQEPGNPDDDNEG